MSDNLDKELEEIMRIVNIDHTKPTADTRQKQCDPKGTLRQKQRGKLSNESERLRRVAKRRKQRLIRKWIIFGCVVAMFVLIVVLICISCAGGKDANTDLTGVWCYDKYTEYEFDGKGNGCMCLDGSNHFAFTYRAEDGTLFLDFALEYVTDCQYTYTVDGDSLTLVGGKGTAEVGKVYGLTRK